VTATTDLKDPYLYTVRFRRRGWTQEQARTFRRRYAADRLIEKLRSGDRWELGLAPLAYVRLERQTLGPVKVMQRWNR
jgi:hypothetical protein